MTQHNLQVPEEWVDEALAEFRRLAPHERRREVSDPTKEAMEAALQAILPKARERLVGEAIGPDERAVVRDAFDSAFPPEDSP